MSSLSLTVASHLCRSTAAHDVAIQDLTELSAAYLDMVSGAVIDAKGPGAGSVKKYIRGGRSHKKASKGKADAVKPSATASPALKPSRRRGASASPKHSAARSPVSVAGSVRASASPRVRAAASPRVAAKASVMPPQSPATRLSAGPQSTAVVNSPAIRRVATDSVATAGRNTPSLGAASPMTRARSRDTSGPLPPMPDLDLGLTGVDVRKTSDSSSGRARKRVHPSASVVGSLDAISEEPDEQPSESVDSHARQSASPAGMNGSPKKAKLRQSDASLVSMNGSHADDTAAESSDVDAGGEASGRSKRKRVPSARALEAANTNGSASASASSAEANASPRKRSRKAAGDAPMTPQASRKDASKPVAAPNTERAPSKHRRT